MYARASNIERYQRWGFVAAPGHVLRAFELERTIDEAGVQLMVRERRAMRRRPSLRRPVIEKDIRNLDGAA